MPHYAFATHGLEVDSKNAAVTHILPTAAVKQATDLGPIVEKL